MHLIGSHLEPKKNEQPCEEASDTAGNHVESVEMPSNAIPNSFPFLRYDIVPSSKSKRAVIMSPANHSSPYVFLKEMVKKNNAISKIDFEI